MNIPKSALFLVLGWKPINDYLDRQRVSYFARIKNLSITRLCKLVLMEVEYSNTSSGWKYLDHLKFVFNNIGLDHLMNNEININTFKRFCGFFCKEKKNSTALIKRAVLNFSKIFVYFKVNNRTCQMW